MSDLSNPCLSDTGAAVSAAKVTAAVTDATYTVCTTIFHKCLDLSVHGQLKINC